MGNVRQTANTGAEAALAVDQGGRMRRLGMAESIFLSGSVNDT